MRWILWLAVAVAAVLLGGAWFLGEELPSRKLDALIAVSPVALLVVTIAYVYLTGRTVEASDAAARAAREAAEAALRQATSMEARSVYDVLPIVWAKWAPAGSHAQYRVTFHELWVRSGPEPPDWDEGRRSFWHMGETQESVASQRVRLEGCGGAYTNGWHCGRG